MNPEVDFVQDISFFVPGIPSPGGSKRFVGFGKKTGRAILIDDAGQRNKNWRSCVVTFAHEHRPKQLLIGPLKVEFQFQMPYLKGHYGTGKNARKLKPNVPMFHIVKPDTLKLSRSTEDALTGVIWQDDASTCCLIATKCYSHTPGCQVTITPL